MGDGSDWDEVFFREGEKEERTNEARNGGRKKKTKGSSQLEKGRLFFVSRPLFQEHKAHYKRTEKGKQNKKREREEVQKQKGWNVRGQEGGRWK